MKDLATFNHLEKLLSKVFLRHLRNKWELRNGSLISQMRVIPGGFFEKRRDMSTFKIVNYAS